MNKYLPLNYYVILFCFINSLVFSQHSNDMFCQSTSRIYLVGSEPYQSKTTLSINLEILKRLNSTGIYPKYFLLESGHGVAFVLNRYMESGDNSLLKDIFSFDTVVQNNYKALRGLNNSLPVDRQFSFYGVNHDFDYETTYLSLRYLLLNKTEFSQNGYKTNFYENPEEKFNYLIQAFIRRNQPTAWSDKDLKEDIDLMIELLHSADSNKVIAKMGAKYPEAKLVLKGYLLSKGRKNGAVYYIPGNPEFQQKRENLILENIYQLFSKDTTAYIFGSFTSYSKLFMGEVNGKDTTVFNTFANSLNSDSKYPLTNNKICASIILYKKDIKKQSKDYGLDKDELSKKYKTLEPNKLYIERYIGKFPMISQTLFYNYKPVRK